MKVVFARATVVMPMPGGNTLLVNKGTHWPADDPFVIDHPDLFADDPRYGLCYSQTPVEEPVETMTAAPGERRRTLRDRVAAERG